MLDTIYDGIKEFFEAQQKAFTEGMPQQRYKPAAGLEEANVAEAIKVTNDMVADAADNNSKDEIVAAGRKSNLILSMARDNHSATRPRLQQAKNYMLYIKRGLYEAPNQQNPKDSDGMLAANIKKVDLA